MIGRSPVRRRVLRWGLLVLSSMSVVFVLRSAEVARGTTAATWQPLPWSDVELLPGDLIFRRGRSALSHAVLAADGRSPFSHVGMVVALANGQAVVHAVPQEEGSALAGVIMEPLVAFLAPRKASAAAVYRPTPAHSWVAPEAAAVALRLARSELEFDDEFDLESYERLYCTELIWVAYREAGIDVLDGVFDEIELPFYKGRSIFPGRLLHSPYFQLVYRLGQESSDP